MDSRKSQLRWKCLHHRSTRFKINLFCRLCTLFEEDGRFVNFINRTGKQIVTGIQNSYWTIRKTGSSIKQIIQTRKIFLVSWYRYRHQLWFHLEVFRWSLVIKKIKSISSHHIVKVTLHLYSRIISCYCRSLTTPRDLISFSSWPSMLMKVQGTWRSHLMKRSDSEQ